VEQLRNASNEHKSQPLETLRGCRCSTPELQGARDACIDAYSHHVLGVQIGQRIRASLDGASDSAVSAAPLQQQLLEMNLEIEEGRARMPLCDERVVQLRLKYKL
jgi:hypothetical protein